MTNRETPRLRVTNKYDTFVSSKENRPLNLESGKAKGLKASMQKYGFLPAYPVMCCRTKNGKLEIRDGQHRVALATELGLWIWYVIDDTEINIPDIQVSGAWNIQDYAGHFAAKGNKDYQEIMEFSEKHQIPLNACIQILGDSACNPCLNKHFIAGSYKIRSRRNAERVAKMYSEIGRYNKEIKTRSFIAALFASCLVPEFDDARLISGAKLTPESLIKYGSREGYLEMLEVIYNFKRRERFPLKMRAEDIVRSRSASNRNLIAT